jgi:CheY-like chemotaxis protein
MPLKKTRLRILLAEDDLDDVQFAMDAIRQCETVDELIHVDDGEELLAYLHRRGKYRKARRPDLILLDLNMPRKGGLTALEEIRSDSVLRTIPVVVFTTSNARSDIRQLYDAGASSYLVKPVRFEDLVQAFRMLHSYWRDTVTLPAF